MPEHNKGSGIRRILLVLLILYAAYTLLPAAVYGVSLLKNGDIQGVNASAASSSAESAGIASPLPGNAASPSPSPALSSSGPESSASAPDATPVPEKITPPGFLDDFSLSQPGTGNTSKRSGSFAIYDKATKQVLTVTDDEFLPAALACEMDLSAPKEALKAQAVAIYTFYSRQRDSGEQVNGADFACDSENWLVYVPKETMETRWGEDFQEHYDLLREVTDEVSGQLLTENGKPVCASYFAISGGSTEAASNVWEEGFDYLSAVASPGDRLTDGYLSTAILSGEEFKAAASSYFQEELDFSGAEDQWLKDVVYTPSGYVKTAVLGGKEISGVELRSAFSLRSACLEYAAESGSVTFTVRGWGHGVGMSQAGAIFLAKQGDSYQAILNHYYPGTKLTLP